MDFERDEFFLHQFEDFTTVNLPFEIESESSRGKIVSLMISLILVDENPNNTLLKEILDQFVVELKKIKRVEIIFNQDVKKQEKGPAFEKFNEVKEFFKAFYDSLPKESRFTRERNASILIYGLDKAGKTTILNRLKNDIFTNPVSTTNINIVKLLFQNLSVIMYDTAGQKIYRNLWASHLKNQDGLVFILDVTDEERFEEARSEFYRILNGPELKEVPLLFLLNKIDLKHPNAKQILKYFEYNEIDHRSKKYFLTSARTNKGITDAFNWLATEILSRLFRS